MLKYLTGYKVLGLRTDPSSQTGVSMYPQIGCKQKMLLDKSEAGPKISMPFNLTLFLFFLTTG